MKKAILFLIAIASLFLFFESCTSVKLIGKINMISNRNIDPKLNYQLISTYAGGSDKEIKNSRASSIEAATDITVKKVPGGEFVMNAKIFLVNKTYFAVEGDVWGTAGGVITYRGFKVDDKVTWKKNGKFYTGKITALKDDQTCYVQMDNDNSMVELLYDNITKVSASVTTATTITLPGTSTVSTTSTITKTNPTTITTSSKSNNAKDTSKTITFSIGDKVKFVDAQQRIVEGKIIKFKNNNLSALIEYQNPLDIKATITKKLTEIKKAN